MISCDGVMCVGVTSAVDVAALFKVGGGGHNEVKISVILKFT